MSQVRNDFYKEAIQLLKRNNIRFLIGGAWALKFQIRIHRDTKDLDVFCTYKDLNTILTLFKKQGYTIHFKDARWLAKAFKDEYFIDLIFNSRNSLIPVDDLWFTHSIPGELFGIPVNYVSPEEIFWNKIYVLNRDRYDGSDLNHLILKKGHELNWKWILEKLDHHWQLLLSQLLNFQFVYPSEREKIPKWLFDELLKRAGEQYHLPASTTKLCLGPLIENSEYTIDLSEWGFIN